MGEMEREIKRLRHHVSVLSKKNHRLMENGKSGAVAPIASAASPCVGRREEEVDEGKEVADSEAEVAEEVATVEAEEEAGVVAESVASFEEAEVARPVVNLPRFEKVECKKRRLESGEEEEVLITPLGPRAECGGLLRRVGRESVFKHADPRLVARGRSTPAAVGVSRRLDAWRQSPGASGGYQLRPMVGGGMRGFRGGYGRGRGV